MHNRWLRSLPSRVSRHLRVLIVLLAAGAAHASPRQIAIEVHARGGYPDKLHIAPGNPGYAVRGPEPAQRSSAGWRVKRANAGQPSVAPTHASSARLPDMLLLALVLAGLVVLGAWLLSRRLPPPAGERSDEPAPDGTDPIVVEPGDPDALAAAGRFEEAMRAVLLCALESVGWSADNRAGTTAREVVRDLDGADARRAPLRAIVRHAESVRFGNVPPTRERYAEMRALLERLAASGGAS